MSRARTLARRFATQGLYQWQLTHQDLGEIDAQFLADQDMSRVEVAYFQELLHQVPQQLDEIDGQLQPLLDRPLAEVDPVERAILRIGAYELRSRRDIPYRVVINEGVELAKRFGASAGHKYVNSVLDKLAQRLRLDEILAGRSSPHGKPRNCG